MLRGEQGWHLEMHIAWCETSYEAVAHLSAESPLVNKTNANPFVVLVCLFLGTLTSCTSPYCWKSSFNCA